MNIEVFGSKQELGVAAARRAGDVLRGCLSQNGWANLIVATGASQFEMLSSLVDEPSIDWQRVTAFHLDEYLGLPFKHPASFRGYLWKRFASRLPVPLGAFHYLNGEEDARAECQRVGSILTEHPIDLALVGIGENGHLAFNDPPADFDTDTPYLVVELDDACRRQQLGEGWFPSLDDVPTHAISMSIRQIMRSRHIVCTVPDERKAAAVRDSLQGPVTNQVPASILQRHPQVDVFLDSPAAALLDA
jgi:glucosamine-6-phosphate deaminase